jgi:hypothetical protein
VGGKDFKNLAQTRPRGLYLLRTLNFCFLSKMKFSELKRLTPLPAQTWNLKKLENERRLNRLAGGDEVDWKKRPGTIRNQIACMATSIKNIRLRATNDIHKLQRLVARNKKMLNFLIQDAFLNAEIKTLLEAKRSHKKKKDKRFTPYSRDDRKSAHDDSQDDQVDSQDDQVDSQDDQVDFHDDYEDDYLEDYQDGQEGVQDGQDGIQDEHYEEIILPENKNVAPIDVLTDALGDMSTQ